MTQTTQTVTWQTIVDADEDEVQDLLDTLDRVTAWENAGTRFEILRSDVSELIMVIDGEAFEVVREVSAGVYAGEDYGNDDFYVDEEDVEMAVEALSPLFSGYSDDEYDVKRAKDDLRDTLKSDASAWRLDGALRRSDTAGVLVALVDCNLQQYAGHVIEEESLVLTREQFAKAMAQSGAEGSAILFSKLNAMVEPCTQVTR